jgi:hypothetical protein
MNVWPNNVKTTEISFLGLEESRCMRTRTVKLHERIKCPKPRIIVLLVVVRAAKRPGLEVRSGRKLRVIIDLRSPLVKER